MRGVLLFEQESNGKVRCSPTVGVAIAAALAYSFVASTEPCLHVSKAAQDHSLASTMTWVAVMASLIFA